MNFGFLILVLGIVGFFVLRNRQKNAELLKSVTSPRRGTWSERELILKLLKHGLPPSSVFHDLYLERVHGHYAQIDAAVLTKVGMIVFEVKDYSGWIFGNGYQRNWTQVLAYGREKHRFYNPVLQNEGHIEALKRRVAPLGNIPCYSVIVFYGNCVLRNISHIPEKTYIIRPKKVPKIIDSIIQSNPPMQDTNVSDVMQILRTAVHNGENEEVRMRHIQNTRIVRLRN